MKIQTLAILLILVGLVVAACGSSEDAATATQDLEISPTATTEVGDATSAEDASEPTATAADDAEAPSGDAAATAAATQTPETASTLEAEPAVSTSEEDEATVATEEDAASDSVSSTFIAEVWADNWFALYVNGELVGEDSVPITTERSFNAETFTFEAQYPLTIAIEAKDFKETDSGLEYIGEPNQQMGDGGIIAQFTDTATGEIIAVTNDNWSVLVIHRAPLNTSCEDDPDPDATCEFEIIETPADWTAVGFDHGNWESATVWSGSDVSPKGGYDQIDWIPDAEFIWGSDLEIDNTLLLRFVVEG